MGIRRKHSVDWGLVFGVELMQSFEATSIQWESGKVLFFLCSASPTYRRYFFFSDTLRDTCVFCVATEKQYVTLLMERTRVAWQSTHLSWSLSVTECIHNHLGIYNGEMWSDNASLSSNAGIYLPLPMHSTTLSVCWELHLRLGCGVGNGGVRGAFLTAPRQPLCVSLFLPTAWQVAVRPTGARYIRSLAQLQLSLPRSILWCSSHENGNRAPREASGKLVFSFTSPSVVSHGSQRSELDKYNCTNALWYILDNYYVSSCCAHEWHWMVCDSISLIMHDKGTF